MKTIPLEVIDEVWERVSSASEEEAQALVRRVQEEQPFIMVYLLAMDEEVMGEDERGTLIELGSYILEIVHTVAPDLPQVTGDELEAAEQFNLKQLENLEEGSEMDLDHTVHALFANYNQMPLLGATLEALMADYEDAPELAPENTGMSLLYLKTVIDCLDQNSNLG